MTTHTTNTDNTPATLEAATKLAEAFNTKMATMLPAHNVYMVQSQSALTVANTFNIDCEEIAELATEELTLVKQLQKDLEQKRTDITRNIDATKKQVQELFKQPKAFLEEARTSIEKALLAYQELKENDTGEDIIDAIASSPALSDDPESALMAEMELAAQTAATSQVTAVNTTSYWKGEVTDPKAFLTALVNGEVPNSDEVWAAISFKKTPLNVLARKFKGEKDIPGFKATEDKKVRT